jgi:hypothetical protein
MGLMREMNESLSKRIEFLERQGEQDGYRNWYNNFRQMVKA